MGQPTAAQKSIQSVYENQARARRVTDGLWRNAKKAPMFGIVKKTQSGRVMRKTQRLISSNAFKVLLSGACASVSASVEQDLDELGVDYTQDSKSRPFSMSLSGGAQLMLEQFLSAIISQIVYQTRTIRNGIGRHQRNNKELVRLAIESVRESVFDAANVAPMDAIALPMALARKKRVGEAEAPGEQEVDDAEADADEDDEEEDDE